MLSTRTIAAFALACAMTTGVDGRGDAADDNAALQYWLAFALMPTSDGELDLLNAATSDDPVAGFGVPVGADSAKVFNSESSAGSLMRLHAAARNPECRWGTDLSTEGPTRAVYAERAHTLARLALLRARWRFERSAWDRGIQDLLATMILARHVGRDRAIPALHFGVMIESMAVATASTYLPEMPSAARRRLSEGLAALPEVTPMSEAFEEYAESVEWFVEDLREAERRGQFSQRLRTFMASRDEADRLLAEVEGAEELAESADEARKVLRDAADAMKLGVEDFRRKAATLRSRWERNPLLRAMGAPTPEGEYDEQAVGRCRLALLRAGLALLDGGETALAGLRDPYGQKTFEHVSRPGSFELRSALTVPAGGDRLAVEFGRRRN